jgi:sugar phosphate permease
VVAVTFLAISLGSGLAFYNNSVFYPAYISEFHWSRAVVASGGSTGLFVLGISSPFIGMLADRISVKKIILAGLVCDGLSKISFSFMNTLAHYYITSVVLGVALGCTSLVTVKLLIGKWFKRREGLALGFVIAGYGVGGGVGPILTSYLLPLLGWREVHLVLSASIWGILIPAFWLVAKDRPQQMGLLPDGVSGQETAVPDSQASSSVEVEIRRDLTFREALATPTFWLLCFATLLFHVCILSIREHFVLHLMDFKLNLASASTGLSLLISVSILGRVAFGALNDKYSKKLLIIGSYVILSVTSFALFFAGIPWLPSFARSAAALYGLAALIGLGYGGGVVCIPIVAGECFGLSSLGKTLGVITLFQNALGGVIGPIAVGYIFDVSGSYQVGFFSASMAAFVAVACLSFIKTDLRPTYQGIAVGTAQ